MTKDMYMIIEGAYLTGFEPSSDNLTDTELYDEAEQYLSTPSLY